MNSNKEVKSIKTLINDILNIIKIEFSIMLSSANKKTR